MQAREEEEAKESNILEYCRNEDIRSAEERSTMAIFIQKIYTNGHFT